MHDVSLEILYDQYADLKLLIVPSMLLVFPTSSHFSGPSRQTLPNAPYATFHPDLPMSILLGSAANLIDSPFSAPWVVPPPLSSHASVLPTELPNRESVFQQWVFSDQISSLRVSLHNRSFTIEAMRTYADLD